MAKIKGILQATGSIKGVSFYTRRGSDEVIMRTKGGASKEKIASSPKFEKLRLNQKEWSGCAKMSAAIRQALVGLPRLADYSISGILNGVAKTLQKLDTVNETGRRSVILSGRKDILSGFTLNNNHYFNSVLRVTPIATLDRAQLSASVQFPTINTDLQLVNFPKLPYFRLIVTLGTLSDLVYDEGVNDYVPADDTFHAGGYATESEWFPTRGNVNAQTLEVAMMYATPGELSEATTLILAAGIEFGTTGYDGKPVAVKYAGCAKILEVK